MKQKIKGALQQGQYKNLGLTEKAFDGAAALLATIITNEAEIETKVNEDWVKNLLKSYQSVADEARAKKNEPTPTHSDTGNQTDPDEKQTEQSDLATEIAAAVAAQMKEVVIPLQEKFAAFEAAQTAKTALSNAESTFKGNDYVKKYGDEAADAWERATEMYEATGKKWTEEELGEKAMGYFNKAVAKRGVDTSKPFKSDGGGKQKPDFSADLELLKKEGVEFADN